MDLIAIDPDRMSAAIASEASTTIEHARVGQPAPDFDLPSTKNLETLSENVKLSDYKGRWLILLFYPLDFSFVCPTELLHFSDRFDEIRRANADVIGISTDSVQSHRAWLKTPRERNGIAGVRFPLASDAGGALARRYNILVEDANIALRGLFIIDPDGVLQYEVVHSLNIGRSAREALRVLAGLQTGGLCPAEWEPGDKLLEGSEDYQRKDRK